MRKIVGSMVMPVVRFATRSYVAGDELDDAVDLAAKVGAHGYSCTLCYWNDGREEPDHVASEYLNILDAVTSRGLNGALAIKLPALWEREAPVEQVVARAREIGAPAIFDSHDPHKSDDTLAALERLGGDGLGLAIPGRWRRSLDDVERAIELGARVRVVKGQWPDPDEPDMDLREGYLRIIRRLAGRARFVGVATHDAPLAAQAMQILSDAGTPFEQEFVFPLPIEPAMREGKKFGAQARIYLPYGEAWLPYSISRALQQPQVFYWLARDLLIGRKFSCPEREVPAEGRA